jgi:hypothetical protein
MQLFLKMGLDPILDLRRGSTLLALLSRLCRLEIDIGHVFCFHLFPRKKTFVL